MKNIVIAGIIGLIAGTILGFVVNKPTTETFRGTTNLDTLSLSAGLITGGVLSTTTPASLTLAGTDLINYSTISDLLTVGAATLTLPATSTLTSWLPNTGDRTSIAIVNATTSAFNITIAGGTGTLLQNASTSAAILPGKVGLLFFTRKANTDIAATFIPGI